MSTTTACASHTRTWSRGRRKTSCCGGALRRCVEDCHAESEAPTDWLAKLYGIATATGVELQSGSYQTQGGPKGSGTRVERYEITLPVSGSYTQLRDFVKRSLAEIPILSIDQMSIKRQTRDDGALQAELRLTLHLVKS